MIAFWIYNILFELTGLSIIKWQLIMLYFCVKHNLCLCGAPWKLMKGHVSSCHDVKGVYVRVSQTQTESQSWVCMAVGETVVGFHSGVGCAERCRDRLWFPVSSTSNLPCDTAAPRRPCIVPRPWNSAETKPNFQLLKGLFDIFIKRMDFLHEKLRGFMRLHYT